MKMFVGTVLQTPTMGTRPAGRSDLKAETTTQLNITDQIKRLLHGHRTYNANNGPVRLAGRCMRAPPSLMFAPRVPTGYHARAQTLTQGAEHQISRRYRIMPDRLSTGKAFKRHNQTADKLGLHNSGRTTLAENALPKVTRDGTCADRSLY
jgi:hypothetical protein